MVLDLAVERGAAILHQQQRGKQCRIEIHDPLGLAQAVVQMKRVDEAFDLAWIVAEARDQDRLAGLELVRRQRRDEVLERRGGDRRNCDEPMAELF